MKLTLLVAILLTGPLWAGPSFERSITIDHTKCGSSDSSNFPVLVKLSGTAFKSVANGGNVQNASGYDILFWSDIAHTSALTWEIDTYSATAGTGWFWVKIPTVSHSADTVFYMTYGDPTISTFQSTATAVWSNGFDYVWHGGNGAVLGLADSTSNSNTAINSATPVTATAGQIAGGGNFVAASTEYLLVDTDPAALQPSTITFSIWLKYTGTTGAFAFRKNQGWRFLCSNAGTNTCSGVVLDHTGNQVASTELAAANDGNWHYLVTTFDATSSTTAALKTYMDNAAAVNADAVSTGAIQYTAGAIAIGANPAPSSPWNGQLDEARVSTGVRSADWILTEYNSQSNPASFASVGPETGIGGNRLLLGIGR